MNVNPEPKSKKKKAEAAVPEGKEEGVRRLAAEVPEEPPSSHLGTRLRSYFLTGLIVAGPVAITLYFVAWFINLVDAWVKPLIPTAYLPESYLPFTVPGVGLIFAIVGLMVIGALTANLFGRSLVNYGERLLARMPIVRSVYRTLKQIFETVLSKNGGSFKRVGLIEFPRRGLYSIVFMAGDPPQEIEEKIGGADPLITVFMPNGPNPTTGFILFMAASEVIPLDLPVEDAAKLVVSAGLVGPNGDDRLAKLAKPKTLKPVPEEEPVV